MKTRLPHARALVVRGLSVRAQQHGLTLIEFMIAIALGMMIVAALTLLIAQQSATQGEFEKSSRQIENGRYAMQILTDEIQMAGYYGEFTKVGDLVVPVALPDPCSVAVADIEAAMPFAVQGYDFDSGSAAAGLGACINVANHKPDTDILVVRRADPDTVTIASAASAPNQVFLQTGLTGSFLEFEKRMGTGSDTSVFDLYNKDKATLSALRKFYVRIYFISPCSVPSGANCSSAADGGKPIPTLKVVELTSAGVMTTTPLVEGIENMQIDYGVDTDADGAPDAQFLSTMAAVGDWANVMALRVHLLARNNESSPGYSDAKTYSLGYNSAASAQQVTASTDSYGNNVRPFKRRVFSQMIRLVNPSGRLDK
jgi:type IV pilus assembly protein PilW